MAPLVLSVSKENGKAPSEQIQFPLASIVSRAPTTRTPPPTPSMRASTARPVAIALPSQQQPPPSVASASQAP